jgi:hypothetical protein
VNVYLRVDLGLCLLCRDDKNGKSEDNTLLPAKNLFKQLLKFQVLV